MADIPVLEPADKAKPDPKADKGEKAKVDKAAENAAAKAAADKVKTDKKAEKERIKAEKGKDGAPAAGSKKKLMIFTAIGIVVLAGGGIGGWLMFAGGQKDAKTATSADKAKPKTAKAGKAKEEDKDEPAPKGPAIYVPLEPPFVVNFEVEQNVRFLQVAAQVMTHDAETAELLKANDPMLRNDMLMLLGNQDQKTVATREGKEALRAQALETVRKVVTVAGGKPKRVEAVYFTSFVMQ